MLPMANDMLILLKAMSHDFHDYDDCHGNKDIHFYLLSTGNTSRDRESASHLNVTDYLIKPTSFNAIREVVATAFNRAINDGKS